MDRTYLSLPVLQDRKSDETKEEKINFKKWWKFWFHLSLENILRFIHCVNFFPVFGMLTPFRISSRWEKSHRGSSGGKFYLRGNPQQALQSYSHFQTWLISVFLSLQKKMSLKESLSKFTLLLGQDILSENPLRKRRSHRSKGVLTPNLVLQKKVPSFSSPPPVPLKLSHALTVSHFSQARSSANEWCESPCSACGPSCCSSFCSCWHPSTSLTMRWSTCTTTYHLLMWSSASLTSLLHSLPSLLWLSSRLFHNTLLDKISAYKSA